MGIAGREHVISYSSLDSMTDSYVDLIEGLYHRKKSDAPDTPELERLSINYFGDPTVKASEGQATFPNLSLNTSTGEQNATAE